ncbi:MAG: ABC transporter permease [Clostridia bacterium]|nr:ABC transporter permease [Clostridia bacterium]
MREFLLAFQNLRRRGLSLRLTALSVLIGLSSVILISSIGKSGKTAILQTMEGIGISGVLFTHAYSGYDGISFTRDTIANLQSRGLDIIAMPFSLNTTEVSLLSEKASALLWGVGENVSDYVQGEILYGRFPSVEEVNTKAPVAVVSESLALQSFDRINVLGQIVSIGKGEEVQEYRIIGVMKSPTATFNALYGDIPDFVYAPYTSLKHYHDMNTGHILVKSSVLSDSEIKSQVKDVLLSLYGRNFQLDVTNLSQGKNGVLEVAELLTLMMSFSAATSLLVASVGIASTMFSSVNERRQEIGIMKALGASDMQVALCFLWESLLTCLLGIGSGICFCWISLCIVNRFTSLHNVLDLKITVITLLTTLALGLLAGTIPAIHAARQDPIDALKNNL